MKSKILLSICVAIIVSSCSTAFKTGQTPDDVYYSPAREVEENNNNNDNKKEEYVSKDNEDRYLRMKVRNYSRWSCLDDYSYWYDMRYDYRYNCACNYNSWSYNYWGIKNNYWGSWYYHPTYVINYKNPKYYVGNTSASNITAYKPKSYNNSNSTYNPKTGSTNTSNGGGFGNLVKKVFRPSGNGGSSSSGSNNDNTSWGRPVRSVESGSSSSSAGGKSGGYNSTGSSSSSGRGGRN